MEPVWAVGLMTGTVLDGNIDVALIRTDGETVETFGAYRLAPYPPGLRDLLADTLAAARAWNFDGPEPPIFAQAEAALTDAQAEAADVVVPFRDVWRNFEAAVCKSARDQPTATLAIFAGAGFLLGALWRR